MASGGRHQRHERHERAAPTPTDSARRTPSSDRAPRFAYLIRGGLESIGVRYVSVDLLRRAKKNLTSEREYWALWRLLHDVVLVVLADFQADVLELERLNSPENLESGLLDPAAHRVQMELVRYYLYDWGFVCAAFYTDSRLPQSSEEERPTSAILLVAFAWLLAFSRFFERQQLGILKKCTRTAPLRLPPFPTDVDLDDESLKRILQEAAAASKPPETAELPLDARIHGLHSAFGRLQGHLNDLQAHTRYHQRLLRRLQEEQSGTEAHRDEALPAYVVQLLAGPPARLAAQVQLLTQSAQMLEDEALFYKWINGLVLALNSHEGPATQVDSIARPSAAICPELQTQMHEIHTLFQQHATAFRSISRAYSDQWKAWKSRQRSRSRVQQMETKAERFAHQVQTRELVDPQKLFLRSQRSWAAYPRPRRTPEDAGPSHGNPSTQKDLQALQKQLERVLDEITREFCDVQLR